MPLRERILVAGPPGSGKSYSGLTIARALPDRRFFILDPDDGTERIIRDEFADLKNIYYYFTPFWFHKLSNLEMPNHWYGGVVEAFNEVKIKVKPEDWIIVESLDSLWNMAQSAFVEAIFDKGIGEYFLERRKAMEEFEKAKKTRKLDALDGWKDWNVIKKMHNDDLIIPICYQLPVHTYFTTGFSITTRSEVEKEDPDVSGMYGDSLLRLDGEKLNPRRVQTIMMFMGNKKAGFKASTYMKDRGARRWWERQEIKDFARQYLGGVAAKDWSDKLS